VPQPDPGAGLEIVRVEMARSDGAPMADLLVLGPVHLRLAAEEARNGRNGGDMTVEALQRGRQMLVDQRADAREAGAGVIVELNEIQPRLQQFVRRNRHNPPLTS